jgi:hypothetical protein
MITEQGGIHRKRLVLPLSIAAVVLIAAVVISLQYFRIDSQASISVPVAAPASPVPPAASVASPTAKEAAHVASTVTPNSVLPTSAVCFDLSRREPHSLEGTLVGAIFAEQPNFADVRKGDDPVEGYLLQLDTSICIREDDNEYGAADPKVQISEVQVYPKNWDLTTEAAMRSLLGYKVRIELASAQSEMTGHDHRPLVAQVGNIVPLDANAARTVIRRTMPPRTDPVAQEQGIGEASTTVRAFYDALSFGSGEMASSLVVPEKRGTGPYAPDSISRFYGPLPEPLRLVELKPQGSAEYLVRYVYGTSTRHCQGRALVTTTQRDGLNLIEKIHPLDGC